MTNRLMSVMRAAAGAVVVAVAAAGLGGCNAQGNNLLEANRALNERVTSLTSDLESCHNTNQQLQSALSGRDKAIMEMQSTISDLTNGRGDMAKALEDLQRRFGDIRFGSVDPTTDAALAALAAAHPELLEYIPELGLLRFKSDFTFDSGSDVVKDSARSTLQQLASILNSAAAQYDIKVLGHTDAQPISSKTAARHPTNMHLSAHRAISVRNELTRMGVAAQRFEVAGRGEFDPIAASGPRGNTPQNRRVEIYLMKAMPKMSGGPSSDAPAAAPAAAPAPAPARIEPREEIMK